MKIFCLYTLLLVVIVVETFKVPLKHKAPKSKASLMKRGGWKGLKVAGETGVGIVSLTAALAILSSIEGDTDPEDTEMLDRIAKERERLMSLNSSNWVSPVAWGGSASGIVVLMAFVIIFRIIRKNKSKQESRKEVKMVSVSTIREKEPSRIQFGEVGEFQIKAGAPEM